MAETVFTFVGTYSDVSSAEGDYQAVRGFYAASGQADRFDAAVIGKKSDGTPKVYRKPDLAPRPAQWTGAGWGLATGLAVALFPAIGIGVSGWTADTGAGLATIAAHVAHGISRADLRDLGEILDSGPAALIVVAGDDVRTAIHDALRHAGPSAVRPLHTDRAALLRDLDGVRAAIAATGAQMPPTPSENPFGGSDLPPSERQ